MSRRRPLQIERGLAVEPFIPDQTGDLYASDQDGDPDVRAHVNFHRQLAVPRVEGYHIGDTAGVLLKLHAEACRRYRSSIGRTASEPS